MKRLVIVGGAALLLAGAGNAATGPSLRLASTKPFVVKGAHFKAGERVLVTITIDRKRSSRSQPGRNPLCEQSDVFADDYSANSAPQRANSATQGMDLYLVTPCPIEFQDKGSNTP